MRGRRAWSGVGTERAFAQDVGGRHATLVAQHHERPDGSGYPNGLRTDQIRREAAILGVADVVEFTAAGAGGEQAFPVEFKRGKPKLHRADDIQLCAQGLCLEDMLGRPVPAGALFYAETRRRVEVPFDDDLRALTLSTIADLATVFAAGRTPPPTPHKSRCRACSLAELCRPEAVKRSAAAFRRRMVEADLAGEAP